MKDYYVSYEQAKRLRALGFRWKVDHYYIYWYESDDPEDDAMTATLHRSGLHDHNGIFNNPIYEDGIHYSAPRLDQAAAWMRDCKGIDIEPRVWLIGNKREYRPYVMPPKCKDYIAYPSEDGYEKALELGISKALELLGKEVKE